MRPQEPQQRAARRVELKDPRAGNASVRRYYLAPALTKAAPGEAEALYLLMKIAGTGRHQPHLPEAGRRGEDRLERRRLVFGPRASTAAPSALRRGRRGVALDKVEQGIDRVVHDLRENGVTEAELERAKKQFIAEFVYESDSQE